MPSGGWSKGDANAAHIEHPPERNPGQQRAHLELLAREAARAAWFAEHPKSPPKQAKP